MSSKKKKSDDVTTDIATVRKPPQAIDVEQYVLAAALIDNVAVPKIVDSLSETDFYHPAHRIIFLAIRSLFMSHQPVDIITLAHQLDKKQLLDEAGGAHSLAEMTMILPSSANVEYHIAIIRKKSVARSIIRKMAEVLEEAYDPDIDPEQLVSEAQRHIFSLIINSRRETLRHIQDILVDVTEEAELRHTQSEEGRLIGITSGIKGIDKITGGWQDSDLIIVAGRPSMGKTALALEFARNANVPIGIFSLEMSDRQLVQRVLCSNAEVDSQRFRNGRMNQQEWDRIVAAAATIAAKQIFIDDTPGLSITKLAARAQRMVVEKEIKLLIVDYLQLMESTERGESRQQEISTISRGLKALAKQLDIPVLALSQLSRAVESRPDKRPMLSDLRESGAIEQDADLVMFVYREEFYIKGDDSERLKEVKDVAELIIAKHRNGPIGTVKTRFRKQFGKFSDFESNPIDNINEEIPIDTEVG